MATLRIWPDVGRKRTTCSAFPVVKRIKLQRIRTRHVTQLNYFWLPLNCHIDQRTTNPKLTRDNQTPHGRHMADDVLATSSTQPITKCHVVVGPTWRDACTVHMAASWHDTCRCLLSPSVFWWFDTILTIEFSQNFDSLRFIIFEIFWYIFHHFSSTKNNFFNLFW